MQYTRGHKVGATTTSTMTMMSLYKARRQENASQQKHVDIATQTPDQQTTKNSANTEQATCKNKTLCQSKL